MQRRAVLLACLALGSGVAAGAVPTPHPGDPGPTRPSPAQHAPTPLPHLQAIPRWAAAVPTGTWVVASGDNMWRIASRVTDGGRIDAVAGYWRRLIAINEGGLISGDPDLIYPGETLDLPQVVP